MMTMATAPITQPEAHAMWTNLAAYCQDQAKKRAAEGRHDRARAWRFEAQQAEAKAAQVERQQQEVRAS